MKNLFLLFSTIFFMLTANMKAQTPQLYCDFDGIKNIYFGFATGMLDTTAANPAANTINSSAYCAKYTRRDTALYDNFQIHPFAKLSDVSPYESGGISAPKISMKIYSTAPIGTIIQLQLGSSSISAYPAGSRSEFVAYTTAINAWQDLKFNFYQMTPGGTVAATNIDKMVFLYRPGTNTSDTLYVDDIKGPVTSTVGIFNADAQPAFKLFQNSPNPAKENTRINFQINIPGEVTLKLYDMLGNPVSSLLDQNLKPGNYSIPLETANIPTGIYFYVLKKEGMSRSMKMIVSR